MHAYVIEFNDIKCYNMIRSWKEDIMEINYSKSILKLRVELNISQMKLAEMLGVSFSSINRWERGKFEPTLLVKEKIKRLFIENNIKMVEEDEW